MTGISETDPRVLVVQLGARRQYAMPAALESAGMLEALYTDMCGTVGLGRWLAPFEKAGGARLTKLLNRRPPEAVAARTRTFPSWTLSMLRAARLTNSEERVRAQDHAHRLAGQTMARAGFGSATHLMVMLMEARGLLTAAKDRGLTTITDVNVALSSEQIVRDERRRNPGWEPDGYFWGETLGEVDPSFRPSAEVIEKTDIFLCPSEFVRCDLVEIFGVARERTILLPYAANPRWFDVVPAPITGRILFAGEAGLRKGIHILAAAAAILKGRGRTYEYCIAGNASETVRARSETAPLTFLGRLGYQAMREEFSRADVFAFPSLSEGSAGVTYEAMGCAVPVVTTNAAGSVARDGVEGVIVPEGDPDALADALERIIEDRATRDEMARAARRRAQMYSWDTYTDRFAAAILGGTSVSA